MGDIVPPACPRSSPGSPPSGTHPEHLPRKASRRHPEQMPEPPQLAPLDVEEQRLYSELLPSDRAPHPISKGSPSHPAEKAHFGHLYPGSCLFDHDPQLSPGELENVSGAPPWSQARGWGSYESAWWPGLPSPHGVRPGSARRSDVGSPSRGLTTRRRDCKGPVLRG
ncbi:hypothetical protein PO909_002140 [Leuciscus waleckii]